MRFLVTTTLLLGTLIGVGCKPFKSRVATKDQIEMGNESLAQANEVEKGLARYNLALAMPMPNLDYNWKKRTRAERQELKRMLAHYLALSNSVLELDARKGLYVTHKEAVTGKRDAASEKQRSLETFEAIFGENYEPGKDAADQPDYVPAHNI